MSANPKSATQVRPLEPRYLTMESNLIGKQVGFVLNARNVLPAIVIGYGTPISTGKRLHLRITEEVPTEIQNVDTTTGEIKRTIIWEPIQREMKNVRYADPSLILDPETRQPLTIDGKTMHSAPVIDKFLAGTWFFIDHYQTSLDFWRPAQQKKDRIHGVRLPQYDQEEIRVHYGPFDDFKDAWELWEREGKRKAHVGWWSSINMTFEFKEGVPEVG